MPQVQCRVCSEKFYAKPSHIVLGHGKYCSLTCRHKAQLKGRFVGCHICSKEVWRMPKDLSRAKSNKFFCSKKCQTIWRNKLFSGMMHPLWRGGESTYRKRMKEGGIFEQCKRCKINDPRVLAVHHVDKNRKNNDLENLVWLCHNCHFIIHHDKLEENKFFRR